MVKCNVVLLDQDTFNAEVPRGALGQELYDMVKQKLGLEEVDFYSLSYKKQNLRFWLNLDKKIEKQLDGTPSPFTLSWEVKFYPPAPEILSEDVTRYLLVLQVRKDLFEGRLPASFQTLALLGSYTVQSELGDYDKSVHLGIEYLRRYTFAPIHSEELLMRISDLHKTHKGLTPAESDLYFLDNVKKLALYGTDLFPVKDPQNINFMVGVSASGLYLYDEKLRMDAFKWPRILKISYKRNIFFVKVRPGEYEKHEKTFAFKLPTPKLAKRLWRISVEHHQFFRLNQPELTDSKTLAGFGPRKWRMSGRTLAQLKAQSTSNLAVPGGVSRSNSIMSSDNLQGTHVYNTGTLPLPSSNREIDGRANYNTFGGRRNEKMVTGFDEYGNPINDYLNDSTLSRGADGTMRSGYNSEDDMLSGQGYNPATGTMSDMTATMDRRPNGDYQSYDDIQKQNASLPLTGPYGAGELPLPYFSHESAGVNLNGAIDDTYRLDTSERGEKRSRLRGGNTNKRRQIVVAGDLALEDQLLLNAIQSVTGLNPNLGVDKIEIKTEEE